MRSACEVSACSVLTDINVPRGCALIQPSTARLGRQIRCVCASPAWLEAQQDPFLDRSSWRSVVASVARLMTGHRIAREFESLGEEWYHSNASPYATQRRKQKDEPDRQNAEIGSETWKNRRGNLVGIRIEVRLVQKTFKSRWEPGRIVNSMQMEMSLAKSPNKVCFYKDLHVVSLIVWAVFFQFVTIVNFVIKLFFFCIRFMNSAHTCFTNAHNFSNKVCFYKDLLQ